MSKLNRISMADVNEQPRKAKHLLITDQLREQVLDNQFNGRLPSMLELADAWSVAPITMKKAVDTLKEEGVLRVVRGQGIFPTRLKRRRSHVLAGILYGDGGAPLHSQLIHGLSRAAVARGEGVVIGKPTEGSVDSELMEVRRLWEKQGVDGFVIWLAEGADKEQRSPTVNYMKKEKIPFVLIPEPNSKIYHDCSTVSNVDSMASADVMTHLIASGHRKIGLVCNEYAHQSDFFNNRRVQYERSLKAAGYETQPPIQLPAYPGRKLTPLSKKTEAQIRSCSAVFCVTDHDAFALMHFCLRLGIRVPEDLAIAGYDNVMLSEVIGLTSVEQHFSRIAEKAVRLLLDEIEGKSTEPVHLNVSSELIVRTSTQVIGTK
mgnify:FL=1